MSKMYDNLKQRKRSSEDDKTPDLFAFTESQRLVEKRVERPPPATAAPSATSSAASSPKTKTAVTPPLTAEPEAREGGSLFYSPSIYKRPKPALPLGSPEPEAEAAPTPAQPKRPLLWLAIASGVGLLLLLTLGIWLFHGESKPAPSPADSQPTVRQAPPQRIPVAPSAPTPTLKAAPVTTDRGKYGAATPAPVPAAPSAPDLSIAGARVQRKDGGVQIVFDAGLFAKGLELTPAAKTLIAETGRKLRPHTDRFIIQVIGYTDNMPVKKGREFKDNNELGLLRAQAVAKHMQYAAGVAQTAITVASGGMNSPPYPNDTPANRARNRTAVIQLIPR